MSTRSPSILDSLRLVAPSAKTAPRLRLEPTGSHQGMLDGAWWPRSRNPANELPALILAIDGTRGQVLRLVLAATGWDERPRRVTVDGRAIIIDYFGSQPAALLTAVCAQSRVDLLVIPASAGSATAHAAMINATTTGNRVIAPRPPTSRGTSRAVQQRMAEEKIGAAQHNPAMWAASADDQSSVR